MSRSVSEVSKAALTAAARFSATSERPDSEVGFICANGRRVRLDVFAVDASRATSGDVRKARLREDVVARRVARDLEQKLGASVPVGSALVVTLGAPIVVPKRLVASLTDVLSDYLRRGTAGVDEERTILDNRVRFRVVRVGTMTWRTKVNVFVFTGDPAPERIAGTMRAIHDGIVAQRARLPSQPEPDEAWLVLTDANACADSTFYRSALAKLAVPHGYTKIVMVVSADRVDVLAER